MNTSRTDGRNPEDRRLAFLVAAELAGHILGDTVTESFQAAAKMRLRLFTYDRTCVPLRSELIVPW
jgi:hypothetical protein